jgi:hypothetical protein
VGYFASDIVFRSGLQLHFWGAFELMVDFSPDMLRNLLLTSIE